MIRIILSFLALAVFLSGCDSIALWKSNDREYDKDKKIIETKQADIKIPPSPVVSKNKAYVDTTPVSLNRDPAWYSEQVSLNGAQLPFSFYVNQLLGSAPVDVHMEPSVNPARMVTMHYNGTIKGALSELAAKSDYFYNYDASRKSVTWSALQTKVFDISFIPGVSKYSVGPTTSPSLTSSSAGGGSGGGTTTTTVGIDITATGEYSNISNGSLSVWDDIKNTVTTLLSPKGKLSVSQSTTTITVHDRPSNVRDISHYLAKMNKILSKQVHFNVQVLDVQLNKQFQYGINWNEVQYVINSRNSSVGFNANFSTAAGGILTNQNPASFNYFPGNKFTENSQIMLQALEQQGKVTIVTQPSITTLNDQVAQLAIQTQQSYLASQTSTITGGNNSLAQLTLTPGTVNYGFQMYLLPKIQDDKIYLQISSVLSSLSGLTIVSQFGQTASSAEAGSTANAIQVPNLAQKNFNQRAVLRNGQTLVMAGFRSLNDNNQKDSIAGLTALGGMAGQSLNEELVVLITPIILNGDNF